MKEISEAKAMMESSNIVRIFKGIIISCIITFILLFIYAAILTYTSLEESTIGPAIIGITGVSILAGSSLTTSAIKKNGILNGGIVGLVYILLIYLSSSITGNSFVLNIYSIIMIIIGIIAGMIGGVVRSKYKVIN